MLRRILKGAGWLAGGLVLLVLLVIGTAYAVTEVQMAQTWDVTPVSIEIEPSEAAIARGRHLAAHVARCTSCHGDDLGGAVYQDLPGLMRLIGPNLTRGEGGVTADYTPRDWVRTIRHGVAPDGRGLVLMPSHFYWELSDADVAAIAAYVESAPAVDRTMDPPSVGPMGRLTWLFGVMEWMAAPLIAHDRGAVPPVDRSDPIAHGRYLARAGGCRDCHGETLAGGPLPGAPDSVAVPRNLTFDRSGLAGWSEEAFARAVRDGLSYPGDRPLDPLMPSRSFHGMTDEEIHALYAFLQSLPHRPLGPP